MQSINKLFLTVYEGSELLYETTLFPPIRSPEKIGALPSSSPKPSHSPLQRILIGALRWILRKDHGNNKKVVALCLNLLLEHGHRMSSSWRQRCVHATRKVSSDLGIPLAQNEISRLSSFTPTWWEQAQVSQEDLLNTYARLIDVVEQPPLRSHLYITGESKQIEIELRTDYSQYHIQDIGPNGRLTYEYYPDRTTAPIQLKNQHTRTRGVMEQSRLLTPTYSCTYSGPLTNSFHVLEEVLHMCNITNQPVHLRSHGFGSIYYIAISSLYHWKDFELLFQQKQALLEIEGKILSVADQSYQLRFLYMNTPIHHIWAPSELRASVRDLNLEAYLWLTFLTYQHFKFPSALLKEWTDTLSMNPRDFFQKETLRLHILDGFQENIPQIARLLEMRTEPLSQALRLLLLQQRKDGTPLQAQDTVLLISFITQSLRLPHHTNSNDHLVDLAYAKALDKAQSVYTEWNHKPFLPGDSSKEEEQFISLYRLYLEWEEAIVHTMLSHTSPIY